MCGGLRHRIARLSALSVFFLWLVLLGAARVHEAQFEESCDEALSEGDVGCELATVCCGTEGVQDALDQPLVSVVAVISGVWLWPRGHRLILPADLVMRRPCAAAPRAMAT